VRTSPRGPSSLAMERPDRLDARVPSLEHQQRRHSGEASGHADELEHRRRQIRLIVHLGYEVRAGDVDERARRRCKERALDAPNGPLEQQRKDAADESRHRDREVEDDRTSRSEAGVHEYPEIADLLRDLVECDRNRRGDAKARAHEEAASDGCRWMNFSSTKKKMIDPTTVNETPTVKPPSSASSGRMWISASPSNAPTASPTRRCRMRFRNASRATEGEGPDEGEETNDQHGRKRADPNACPYSEHACC
jgi:hypothetical protein